MTVSDADRVMYECGVEVLHPGGRDKTDEMARACQVGPGSRVLDLGGGRGTTACYLAHTYGCDVVAIDTSADMVDAALRLVHERGLQDHVSVVQADAHALPFASGCFDAVLIECVTTMLDRARAFPELRRVLTAGGYLGDLEMTYRVTPPPGFDADLREAWGGFTTMPLDGWRDLFVANGFEVTHVEDFSDRMEHLGRTFVKDLGVAGVARLTGKLLARPGLVRDLAGWEALLRRGRGVLGYGYVVGRRIAAPSD